MNITYAQLQQTIDFIHDRYHVKLSEGSEEFGTWSSSYDQLHGITRCSSF